jgi:hypothetical protein
MLSSLIISFSSSLLSPLRLVFLKKRRRKKRSSKGIDRELVVGKGNSSGKAKTRSNKRGTKERRRERENNVVLFSHWSTTCSSTKFHPISPLSLSLSLSRNRARRLPCLPAETPRRRWSRAPSSTEGGSGGGNRREGREREREVGGGRVLGIAEALGYSATVPSTTHTV